ncbi:hypothetical protein SmJEL517_g05399 [Synchytrium microbalum]|uniref:guanosine-diphosphatase n=1 Tax=Synchytrium microbalum TaxID=1806994 RepID=A0A507BZL9_9FUNG|nr:uncharacterized protein SmJEL517_g05399 [Synchytrium microbalum]TPX31186.1 hypothetical protein SmJEL517_g05399 [Synchytrium microbalum]
MPPSPKHRLPPYKINLRYPNQPRTSPRWISLPLFLGKKFTYILGILLCISAFVYLRKDTTVAPLGAPCTVGYKGSPPTQYAIMVDAGSTGSRIHVYEFSNCHGAASPFLVSEVFNETKPGLSSYAKSPESAAASLDVLLDEAVKVIPKIYHSCTPIEVKATAGLRLLGAEISQKILATVRKHLVADYPFLVPPQESSVAVMDGADEGVFAWITVNYLLKRFSSPSKGKQGTVAIMDLGGASTQIVFEPTVPPPEPHRVDIALNGVTYILYQWSYLGNGLMEARKLTKSRASAKIPAIHPCLGPNHSDSVMIDNALTIIKGQDDVEFDECHSFVSQATMDKSIACPFPPCSFAGVHHPPLHKHFADRDIYAFSYFYDKTQGLGLPSEFDIKSIREYGIQICDSVEKEAVVRDDAAALDKAHLCLDLAYIYGLLKDGYGIEDDRKIQIAKKITGYETGWCLGAALSLADRHKMQCSQIVDPKIKKGPVAKDA